MEKNCYTFVSVLNYVLNCDCPLDFDLAGSEFVPVLEVLSIIPQEPELWQVRYIYTQCVLVQIYWGFGQGLLSRSSSIPVGYGCDASCKLLRAEAARKKHRSLFHTISNLVAPLSSKFVFGILTTMLGSPIVELKWLARAAMFSLFHVTIRLQASSQSNQKC